MSDDPFVRLYEPGDEAAIVALLGEAFGTERSMSAWRWRNFETPGGARPFIRVLIGGGEVVGHLANIYLPMFVAGRRCTLSLGGDLTIRPDWRGSGGYQLLSTYREHEGPYDVRLSFPIDKVRDRLLAREPDAVFPGTLPQWVRWAPVASVLARSGRASLEQVASPGPEFDALAAESASFAACIRVRDAAYVRWRWLDNPGGSWTVWAARRPRDGSLAGWVVAGHHHDEPADRGRIVDLLAGDFRTARRLLSFAGATLADAGHTLVTFEVLDARPWMRRACLAAGYLERGVGPNILLRHLRPDLRPVAADITTWYLTFGDTDLV